jgi:type IV/VI secretion system ImpK/VasF family protein
MNAPTATVSTLTLTPDGIVGGASGGTRRYSGPLSPGAVLSIGKKLREGHDTGSSLLHISGELLGLCGTIKRMNEIDDSHLVRAQIARTIIDLKYSVVQLDYPPSVAENLCLLFAIVIDEFTLTSAWGKETGWENLTLVADLFGFRDGGDRFYNIAERALMQPKALHEFLRLIYIFLKLGYRGKYVVGQEQERDRLIHRLEEAIGYPDTSHVSKVFGRATRKTKPLWREGSLLSKLCLAGLAIVLINAFVLLAGVTDERAASHLAETRAQTADAAPLVYVYSSATRTTVVRDE